jgi:hypothetical protein
MTNALSFCRRSAAGLMLLAAATQLAAAPASAQSERKNDPGAFAPPDALALLGVTDLDEFLDGYKKSAGYKLLQDPAFKDAPGQFNAIHRFIEEFSKRLAKALDTESEKLKNPFGGTIALMALPPSGESKSPSLVLVAGVKDKTLMREYYTKAVANFKKIADKHESVDFAGGAIDHFTTREKTGDEKSSENEAEFDPESLEMSTEEDVAHVMDKIFGEFFSADSLPESLATYLTDERLVVALSPDDVKGVFRREKSGETLRDQEDYKSIGRQFEKPGPFRLFVNLPKVFDLAKAESPEGFKEMMNIFGGKCMRSVIGHAGYSTGRCDTRVEIMLLTSGERTGLMKILSPKNRAVGAPDGISADTTMFMSAALNPAETLDEIERMIRANDPEAADEMRESLESVTLGEGEKISLRKDIIDNLREPLTFTFGLAKPYSPESPRFTVSIGHRSKSAIERVVEKFRTMVGLLDRDVRGTTVYDAPVPFKLSVALTNDSVIFGSTNSVEEALQTGRDAGLAPDATFKRTLELAPKEAWLMLYVDGKRLYDGIAELGKHKVSLMQQQMTGNIGAGIAYGMAEAFSPGETDNSAALRRVAEFQSAGILTVTTTSDGIRVSLLNGVPDK